MTHLWGPSRERYFQPIIQLQINPLDALQSDGRTLRDKKLKDFKQ